VDDKNEDETNEDYSLMMSLWIDADGYSDRDRQMFVDDVKQRLRLDEIAKAREAFRASRIAAMSIDELKAECEELEWFDLFLNGNGKGEPRGTLRP